MKTVSRVIPGDSRYIPLVQQKSCCVPACISMVMYRHKLPLIPQELLGYYLGLTVAPENKGLFWHPRTGKRPPSGFGTQVYKKEFSPNRVFLKLKIPLRLIFYPISGFTDQGFKNFLIDAVRRDKDILVCFDHGELSGDHKRGGHVCVLDRLGAKTGEVRLIDPQQSQPKWRIVKINKLKQAAEFHGDKNSGGFWELVSTKKI